MARKPTEPDLQARFKTLVLSPLRSGLIRFLHSRQHESFDTEALGDYKHYLTHPPA